MNERIDKLVEQAITQNESGWPDFRKALTGSGSLYLHVFAEEIAELIVGECISVMKSTVSESIDFDRKLDETSSWIESDIKQHFGVQE